MYTVLLADDEESVLDILRTGVNWQELGVEVLLTAQDGSAALELFEKNTIDLLITDIRMPGMNGMELIEAVSSISPDTHCILLTAYSEFGYAQRAIRLGVENYLLKPIVKEEIEQTTRNALNNIYQNRHHKDNTLRDNTLRRWAMGNITEEELSERAAVLGINLYQSAYCAVCLASKDKQPITQFRTACIKALSPQYDVNYFWDEKGHVVLILGGHSIDPDGISEICKAAAAQTNATDFAAVALGDPVAEAEALHSSYQVAADSIELSDLKNSGLILSVGNARGGFRLDLMAEELRTLFFMQSDADRTNGYRHIAHKLCEKKQWEANSGVELTRACIQMLVEEFPNKKGIPEKIYRAAPVEWPTESAQAEQAILDFLPCVRELFAEYFGELNPTVQRTVYFIRDTVLNGESCSLKEFCAKIGMHPAYLGHLFKTETGFFFNDYLMQCRIERSVVLLRNPNRIIKDIAEAVGFAYASYFVRCFRASKGVSPSTYRQEMMNRRA